MKSIITSFLLLFVVHFGTAQTSIGYGFTTSIDVYQNYKNPKSFDGGTSGNVLLNLGVGPKIWVGGKKFSVSLETEANIGLTGFSIKKYNGLGQLAIPMMAKLNFAGLSTFDNEGKMGFSIGGGMQYTRTELYYTTQEFKDGVGKRDYYWLPVAQVGYGFGLNGFTIHGYFRAGYDHDSGATTFNFGVKNDFNLPKLKKIARPESAL